MKNIKVLFLALVIFLISILFIGCGIQTGSGNGGGGGNTAGLPDNTARGIIFFDKDAITEEISGDLIIIKAADESDITGYVLYWGSDSNTKLSSAISDMDKTGSDIIHTFSFGTPIPIGAQYFLVFIKNNNGEMSEGISLKIKDVLTLTSSMLVLPINFQTFGFGWDWDMESPEDSLDIGGAPDSDYDFGNSAFYSNVIGGTSLTRQYTALRIYPQAVFGGINITLGDLKSISYWTKQKMSDGILNSQSNENRTWQIKIYTENPSVTASLWYKTRLNTALQYYNDSNWEKNSTDSNLNFTNSLSVYNKINNIYIPYITIGDGNGTLTDMRINFGLENILFIDIIAGSAAPAPFIQSYLDGVVIELTNGKKIAIDLE